MNGAFLQSEKWEEFQQSLGNETVRVDGALFIRHNLPLGKSYLYCPRPTAVPDLESIKRSASKSDIFVWLDILNDELRVKNDESNQNASSSNLINSKLELESSFSNHHSKIIRAYPKQPKSTLILDLAKTEDELLAKMHQKTRYNIRLAEKHGVRIRNPESSIRNTDQLEIFLKLLQETNARDKIRSHSKAHYQKLLDVAGGQIFTAYYNETPVASAICINDSDSFYYLHGASTHAHKNVMAPYLLQWEMIRYAKVKGFKYYDFWGVDEQKYPGVTRFKTGFAPNAEITSYPNATLLPLRPTWFRIYSLLKK